jgi:hypothetical protein
VPGDLGNDRPQDRGIDHEHGASDPGHAAGHDDEQFSPRQLVEIGPDEQRRFHHADENIGGGRQADRAADAQRALQRPRKAAHDRRQDAPVEQQRGQHAHHQNQRQRLESEDEFAAGIFWIERQRTAAEIAEHEAGTCTGCGGDGVDRAIGSGETGAQRRDFEKQHSKNDGEGHRRKHPPPRYRTMIFAYGKGHRRNDDGAKKRLQDKHVSRPRRVAIVAATSHAFKRSSQ